MEIKDIKPAPLGDIPGSPENFKLSEFRPISLFNTPKTRITKAKFPVIDMHAHAWDLKSDIAEWVNRMDAANIEKTVVLSFETGEKFDAIVNQFKPFNKGFLFGVVSITQVTTKILNGPTMLLTNYVAVKTLEQPAWVSWATKASENIIRVLFPASACTLMMNEWIRYWKNVER